MAKRAVQRQVDLVHYRELSSRDCGCMLTLLIANDMWSCMTRKGSRKKLEIWILGQELYFLAPIMYQFSHIILPPISILVIFIFWKINQIWHIVIFIHRRSNQYAIVVVFTNAVIQHSIALRGVNISPVGKRNVIP